MYKSFFNRILIVFSLTCAFGLLTNQKVYAQEDEEININSEDENKTDEENTEKIKSDYNHAVDTFQYVFRPRLGLGIGELAYRGELNRNLQGYNPMVGRAGYYLYGSAPINAYLRLEFSTLFGQVAANQRTLTDNYNFKSRIRIGSIQLYYNFYPLINGKIRKHVNPFVGTGLSSFEFLTKSDMKDAQGRTYHYWSDGSLMDRSENHPDAANAIPLQRDYTYESDLRELDLDGLGKYREQSFSLPLTYGFEFHLSPRFDLRVAMTYHLTFTDLIDNISPAGQGSREGDNRKDKLIYTYFSFGYDLVPPNREKEIKEFDDPQNGDMYVWLDSTDTDGDGVIDMIDQCAYTPLEAEVDEKGCPMDTDRDFVPDYLDDEPYYTSYEASANERGIEITDEEWEKRYLRYTDTTGEHSEFIYVYTIKQAESEKAIFSQKKPSDERKYIIVIGKEKKGVSANDLHKYLGFKNFKVVEKNDTIYYVVGEYKTVEEAVLAKQELDKKGVKVEAISRTSDNSDNVVEISESAIKRISDKLAEDGRTVTEKDGKGLLFRVQIGAFSKMPDKAQFKNVPDLLYATGEDGLIRFYSGGFPTMEDAAKRKTDLMKLGYPNAFVVSYKDAERVTLKEAGVEVTETYSEEEEKETFVEKNPVFSAPKITLEYRVKVGEFKGEVPVTTIDLYLSIGSIVPMKLADGTVIYYSGKFKSIEEAQNRMEELKEEGIDNPEIFVEHEGKILTPEDAQKLIED